MLLSCAQILWHVNLPVLRETGNVFATLANLRLEDSPYGYIKKVNRW
jgi:hypothetical protein